MHSASKGPEPLTGAERGAWRLTRRYQDDCPPPRRPADSKLVGCGAATSALTCSCATSWPATRRASSQTPPPATAETAGLVDEEPLTLAVEHANPSTNAASTSSAAASMTVRRLAAREAARRARGEWIVTGMADWTFTWIRFGIQGAAGDFACRGLAPGRAPPHHPRRR